MASNRFRTGSHGARTAGPRQDAARVGVHGIERDDAALPRVLRQTVGGSTAGSRSRELGRKSRPATATGRTCHAARRRLHKSSTRSVVEPARCERVAITHASGVGAVRCRARGQGTSSYTAASAPPRPRGERRSAPEARPARDQRHSQSLVIGAAPRLVDDVGRRHRCLYGCCRSPSSSARRRSESCESALLTN